MIGTRDMVITDNERLLLELKDEEMKNHRLQGDIILYRLVIALLSIVSVSLVVMNYL